jgi:hypothetical protein
MSLSANRFKSVASLSMISLEQALFEEGYEYDNRRGLVDVFTVPGSLSREQAYSISSMDDRQYENLVASLSTGARYIARRIRDGADPADMRSLTRDWAALKDVRHYLYKEYEKGRWQRLLDLGLVKITYNNEIQFHPSKLLRLGIRFAKDVARFLALYEEVCSKQRPWGSCYQPDHYKVKAIALTPNYNRLPLWVKKVLIQSRHWVQTERVGNIWRLIPVAKAWKVCPDLPKGIAERIGKLPQWKRVAAKLAWQSIDMDWRWNAGYVRHCKKKGIDPYADNYCVGYSDRRSLISAFWQKFNDLCQQGVDAVLLEARETDRAVSIKFGKTLPRNGAMLLAALVGQHENPVSLLIGLKSSAFYKAWLRVEHAGYCHDEGVVFSRKQITEIAQTWQSQCSLSLVLTFGNEWQRWLDKNEHIDRFHHDATYWLPVAPAKSLEGLSKWLFKYGDRPIPEISIVAKKWQHLSEEERNLPYKSLIRLVKSSLYENAKSVDFAYECGQWGVPKWSFRDWEARFLTSQKTPSPFQLNKRWKVGGIVGRFLPRSDARGLFLGHYTNCCQHPDGFGEACAWYGQESPKSGFFVWESGEEIIAQSWCWVSDDGKGVCFDNIEAKGLGDRQDAVADILEMVATDLSSQFAKVTLGTGLSDLNTSRWTGAIPLKVPRDYSGHIDSANQVLLAHNPSLAAIATPPTSTTWVRGALASDLEACEAIASNCYPEGWQFVPEADQGFILEDSNAGIIGYACIESRKRYISDIAVHPDHRSKSMSLVNAVLDSCRGGAIWRCHARESTSYRLLNLLARRRRIEICQQQRSGESMAGEPMYKINFVVR